MIESSKSWVKICLILTVFGGTAYGRIRCGYLEKDPSLTDHHDSESEAGQFPFLVGLKDRESQEFHCVGTLILNRFILTASHCIVREDYLEAYLGTYNVSDPSEPRRRLPIRTVHFRKDFALLELFEDVTESESICMIHPGRGVREDEHCFTAGWQLDLDGKWHSTLKYLEVAAPISQFNDSRKLLAKSVRKTRTCLADYGSPMFCGKNNRYSLVGVTTRSRPDCAQDPSLFTNIYFYGAWIHGEYIDSIKHIDKNENIRVKRATRNRRKNKNGKKKPKKNKRKPKKKRNRNRTKTKPRTNQNQNKSPAAKRRNKGGQAKKKSSTPYPGWSTTWRFKPKQFKCYNKSKLRSARKKKEKEGGYLRVDCDSSGVKSDEEVYDSRRCCQYETKQNKKDIKRGKIELGCWRDNSDEQEQECVLDDPLCNHDFCAHPDGWCYKMFDWNDGPSWQFEEIGDLDLPLNFG